jgi:hypothetical protein
MASVQLRVGYPVRETARANLRRLVRRVMRKHGYPPDKQAELMGAEWAA